MSLVIDFNDETNELTEQELNTIENLLHFAAKKESIEDGSELSVTFVTNDRIQEINREYRDKDKATDVISFAMEELGEGEIPLSGVDMPRNFFEIFFFFFLYKKK